MERRFNIAGIELAVACDDAALLADLVETWRGYDPGPWPPDVTVGYTVDRSFRGRGGGAPAPGFDARALSEDVHVFEREDAAGRVELGDVVIARFTGRPARGIVEAAVRVALAAALPRAGGVLIHGAGAIIGGRAVLCSGPSGVGKSTLERRLRGRYVSLGDELTVARRGWTAHATPFAGENGAVARATAPLGAVCFLEQAAANRAVPLARPDAVRRLLRNVMAHVLDRAGAERVLAVAADLVAAVPCYTLELTRDSDVADVLEAL